MENSLNDHVAQEHNGRMLKNATSKTAGASELSLWASCNSNSSNNNNSDSSATNPTVSVKPNQYQQQQSQQQRWKRKVTKPLKAFCEVVGVSTNNCNKPTIATPTTTISTTTESASIEGGGDEKKLQHNGGTNTNSANSRHNINKSSAYVDIAQPTEMWSLPNATAMMMPMSTTTTTTADSACDNEYYAGDAAAMATAGAVSLTPPDNSHSNRTSMNNSTENLSYSSDNYYPDDLILLDGDDDDAEGEEISLNSDDCVYAYRGDGAEYDIDIEAFTNRSGCVVGGLMDDETDFLEMDFEPDPLSEIEFGIMEMTSQAEAQPNEAFLLQRDSCHLSGRHSASLQPMASPTQRQLFSSPIDDLLPPPPKALQSQAMLSKHFARISLHLDQIKGETSDCECDMRTRNECLSVMGDTMADCVDLATAQEAQASAHSLPNTLHTSFSGDGGDINEEKERKASPTKITGAKPKRLSTFSTSSSTSSKNSSKSRSSLRSAYAPPLGGSSSFDERSVSCTEFSSSGGAIHGPSAAPPNHGNEDCLLNSVASVGCDDFYATEDFCLDCLEKEFLANTIGKALESSECARCRRHIGGHGLGGNSLHRAYMLGRSTESTRCRSGSPTSFLMEVRDDCLYGSDATHEFLQTHRHNKRVNWLANASTKSKRREGLTKGRAEPDLRRLNWNESCESDAAAIEMNQRRSTCDNYNSEHQLLKNFLLTEPEIVTISTVNLTEETLVQALDKLHISYNIELLQSYFKSHNNANSNGDSNKTKLTNREFKSIKHLLLHESKKFSNHKKLKRLIEMATCQRLNVQFKPDTSITRTEMVAVKVSDILHQWTRTSNLELLKQLDKRFVQANVLGKVANIIRQAQQQRGNTTRRALPEFIYIPQYYASGFLTLSKKM